jgi:TRAP-type C4-dicarboxylate transport system permease small subunit
VRRGFTGRLSNAAAWLGRRAENVAVLLLATMFVALIVQVFFRYFVDMPMGWTDEISLMSWVWLVLWGAAFVVRQDEEIRFELLQSSVGARGRRWMSLAAAAALVALFAVSLPAVVDYVTFMKVQRTAYLHVRFDWLFSIYIAFAVAAIVRYLWIGWRAVVAGDEAAGPPGGPATP